jgi:ATP-dependent DNA ligase
MAVWTRLAGRQALLDGELVHLGADGKPDFAALRRRLIAGHAGAATRAGHLPSV